MTREFSKRGDRRLDFGTEFRERLGRLDKNDQVVRFQKRDESLDGLASRGGIGGDISECLDGEGHQIELLARVGFLDHLDENGNDFLGRCSESAKAGGRPGSPLGRT